MFRGSIFMGHHSKGGSRPILWRCCSAVLIGKREREGYGIQFRPNQFCGICWHLLCKNGEVYPRIPSYWEFHRETTRSSKYSPNSVFMKTRAFSKHKLRPLVELSLFGSLCSFVTWYLPWVPKNQNEIWNARSEPVPVLHTWIPAWPPWTCFRGGDGGGGMWSLL